MLSVQWRDCEVLELWLTLEEIEQSTEAERIHDQDLNGGRYQQRLGVYQRKLLVGQRSLLARDNSELSSWALR